MSISARGLKPRSPSPRQGLAPAPLQLISTSSTTRRVRPRPVADRGRMIPQSQYRPHTATDRDRYVNKTQLHEPVLLDVTVDPKRDRYLTFGRSGGKILASVFGKY